METFFTNLSDLENGIIIQAYNGAHKQGILQFFASQVYQEKQFIKTFHHQKFIL